MKNGTQERAIFDLLTSLKNTEDQYPSDLMQSRREMFAKQAASAAIAIHAAGSDNGQTASASTSTSAGSSVATLVETALVIAIAIEAIVGTYIYREKIADLINSVFPPRVEQVVNPSDDSSSPSENLPVTGGVTPSASPAITATPTPASTLSVVPQINNDGNNTEGGNQVSSTPDPNGNNGLHLGQTKQAPDEPKKGDNTNNLNNDKNNSDPPNKKNK